MQFFCCWDKQKRINKPIIHNLQLIHKYLLQSLRVSYNRETWWHPLPPPILNLTITGQLVEQEKCSSWGNACLGHKIIGPVEIRLEKREKYLLRSRREIRGEKVGKKYLVRHQSSSSCKVFFSQPWPHCRSCEQTRSRQESRLYLKKGQHVVPFYWTTDVHKNWHVEPKVAQVFIRHLIHYVS